jgi:flagellar biosynthesis protein FlhG
VDIVIIDTGAGIADSVLEFVTASSEILLIATPDPTSITDSYALLKTLNRKSDFSVDDTVIKMIVNRVPADENGEEIYEKLSIVVTRFLKLKLEYLGYIPVDNSVSKAVMRQKPAISDNPNSSFSKLITGFAEQLCDTEPDIHQVKKGIAQLFSNLLKSRIRK